MKDKSQDDSIEENTEEEEEIQDGEPESNVTREVGHVIPTIAVPQIVVLNDFIHRANWDIEDTRSLDATTSKAIKDLSARLIPKIKLEAVLATISSL